MRTSTIDDVTSKVGRTGPLVFVTVRHEVRSNGADEPALVEFHDIVYRAERSPDEVEPPPTPADRPAARRGSARSCPTTCCCSATRR